MLLTKRFSYYIIKESKQGKCVYMKLYEELYTRIKQDVINAPGVKPGMYLPTRSELMDRFGGSTRPMMRAIMKLEKEGLVNRVSPRKFTVATNSKVKQQKKSNEPGNIGMINFEGHLYSDFAHMLIPRLYDRQFRPMLMPQADSQVEVERIANRFFDSDFEALLVHDYNLLPATVWKNRKNFKMFIQLFVPFNILPVESHCLFIDESFFMYDALTQLYEAGYKHVTVFDSDPPPPGCSHPRDQRLTGIEKFKQEYLKGKTHFKLNYTNRFNDVKYNEKLMRKWVKELPRETEAIICSNDYAVIKVREWIAKYSDLNYRNIQFTGCGNTDWSKNGPEQFPSYDYRLDDLMNMTLELLDERPVKAITRRIKPKPVRMNMINKLKG